MRASDEELPDALRRAIVAAERTLQRRRAGGGPAVLVREDPRPLDLSVFLGRRRPRACRAGARRTATRPRRRANDHLPAVPPADGLWPLEPEPRRPGAAQAGHGGRRAAAAAVVAIGEAGAAGKRVLRAGSGGPSGRPHQAALREAEGEAGGRRRRPGGSATRRPSRSPASSASSRRRTRRRPKR